MMRRYCEGHEPWQCDERCAVPEIVVLCGSTRFKDAFDEANYRETMDGRIVLSVGFFMHATGNRHGNGVGATPEQKIALDELHKRKIDLADSVLVLNVGGYIGESTRSEIEYAIAHGKPVRYLEDRTEGALDVALRHDVRSDKRAV